MDIIPMLGIAASLSLLAGWRIYLCVFATGLAMHFGMIEAPSHVAGLQILAHPWVIGIAGLGLMLEFFADKVAWLDSLWDVVHDLVRPIGGALLALAVMDPVQPVWQILALLLGGSGALISHSAKAGTRAIINASPEPFSNIAVSIGEDVISAGLVLLIFNAPIAAALTATILLFGALALMAAARRMLNRMFTPPQPQRGG